MQAFTFSSAPFPIRDDLIAAYRDFWSQLANAGTWWNGAERVAIANEVRRATQCAYCVKCKNALSPFNVPGEHTAADDTPLDARTIDAVHRVITDQTRITKAFIQGNAANGLSEGQYVELVGVVVCAFGIDEFCRALGLPLEPLPAPVEGEPSEYVPDGLESETAMVSMIGIGQGGPDENDLWPDGHTANVIRALSQVPNSVREWLALSDVQYLPTVKIRDPASDTDRVLNRMQIEIVAGRVSSHNECFY
jgi:hypothetical protein